MTFFSRFANIKKIILFEGRVKNLEEYVGREGKSKYK